MNFPTTFLFVVLSLRIMVMHGEIITSCNQTPHPQVCNHFMTNNNLLANLDDTNFSFHKLSLKVTMDQALQAHQLISKMNLSPFKNQAKVAWDDCVVLYQDIVDKLDRSMSSNNHVDAQTWLSAALANKETCHNGFTELNLSSQLESLPIMLNNFTKLLSNSLAITKAAASTLPQKVGNRHLLADEGFPVWVSGGDRRLLQSTGAEIPADIVVAQDGSRNFKTINEAVAAAASRKGGGKRIVIKVKAGVYNENVEIKKSVKNLMIVGDGIDATIVTGSKNVQDGSTTLRSATFAVSGEGFIARDITFENTAGPQKHQAVALQSSSDFSVFHRCSFKGYQDTLYVHSQRQFYRDCDIHGTVDFIFGDAVAILQNCNIYVRKSMANQKNTVTAQGRTDPNENTGIVIQNSRVTAAPELRAAKGLSKSYLGRPWKEYSRTVFMKCVLDDLIDPAGWLEWSGGFALRTLYYGEYMNTGVGAETSRRVNWPGYHVITSSVEAGKFTVGNFLDGGSWITAAQVPFDSGL